MWPRKQSGRIDPLEYAIELREAVQSTWNRESGLDAFLTDGETAQRFFFSSYILAMLFFGTKLLHSAHSIFPTSNKKVLNNLSTVFPSMDGEPVTVGKFIVSAGEISDFPSHAKEFGGIETTWHSCSALTIPMPKLIMITYWMRFAILNRTISESKGVTPEEVREVWNPYSILFTAAGSRLANQIFIQPSLLEVEDVSAFAKLEMQRCNVFRQYSFDLYGIIMQVIDKRS